MCGISITINCRFSSVESFLFFYILHLGYCIRILLTCFHIYLLVYFEYFKVRKPTFLYHSPSLVSKFWLVIFNLAQSSQISIILFPHLLCVGLINSEVYVCCLSLFIFFIGVSDLSGCLVRPLCTCKKTKGEDWEPNVGYQGSTC